MAEQEQNGDKTYKPGNIDDDGNYKVGKCRPPDHGKFRKGDGRERGRRKKGTKNLATDFTEELSSKVTLKVDGQPRRVTKQRAIMMRLMDNASRGQNTAINTIMAYAEKFGIDVQLAPEEPQRNEYPHIKELTDYEFELLDLLLAKASGNEPLKSDRPLYEEGDPLAYLENPDDPRNFWIDQTLDGIVWKRFRGTRFTDHIIEVRSVAYHSAARPRRKRNVAIETRSEP